MKIPKRLLIFGKFSRGFGLITDLKDLDFTTVSLQILRGYVLTNCPEATFIQGATSILDSRVLISILMMPFYLPLLLLVKDKLRFIMQSGCLCKKLF